MDRFDEYLKNKSNIENKEFILPKSFEDKLEDTLDSLDKIDTKNNWYRNRKIWTTVACFIFVCFVGISIESNFKERKSSNKSAADSGGIPEVASHYSEDVGDSAQNETAKSRISEFSLNDELSYNFIDSSNIDKLIFKSIEDNKYKIIDKKEDIENVINFINDISGEKIESKSINDWNFLIQTSGVDSNHSIIIEGDIMNVDEEWYKINSQQVEKLKDIYSELNYEEKVIPYCDVK